jgi:hypothetical protein
LFYCFTRRLAATEQFGLHFGLPDLFDVATTYNPKEAQMYLEIIFDWDL